MWPCHVLRSFVIFLFSLTRVILIFYSFLDCFSFQMDNNSHHLSCEKWWGWTGWSKNKKGGFFTRDCVVRDWQLLTQFFKLYARMSRKHFSTENELVRQCENVHTIVASLPCVNQLVNQPANLLTWKWKGKEVFSSNATCILSRDKFRLETNISHWLTVLTSGCIFKH